MIGVRGEKGEQFSLISSKFRKESWNRLKFPVNEVRRKATAREVRIEGRSGESGAKCRQHTQFANASLAAWMAQKLRTGMEEGLAGLFCWEGLGRNEGPQAWKA